MLVIYVKPGGIFMNYTFYDFLGNIGVALIIIMYLLLQMKKVQSDSYSYSLLNAIGAGLILLSLLAEFNLSAFIVETFWLLVSLYGLYRWKKQQV
jgi:hypothetical protein